MKNKSFICPRCGDTGKPKKVTKGSTLIELLLLCCFLLPGVIYGVWRVSSRSEVCGTCGSDVMVPLDSPMGQSLHERLHGRAV
jgi:hypothetical protein